MFLKLAAAHCSLWEEQPYYLYDAPNLGTYINAYCSLPDVQIELVERLMGTAPFTGVSPVDAFCGCEQLQW
jgi:beta-N-acetylhexosaminidase